LYIRVGAFIALPHEINLTIDIYQSPHQTGATSLIPELIEGNSSGRQPMTPMMPQCHRLGSQDPGMRAWDGCYWGLQGEILLQGIGVLIG